MTHEIDLRDFPADVQDLLKDRAIKERRPIGDVIADYVIEVARAVLAAAPSDKEKPKDAA